jgi:hypothetical protein
MDFYTLLAVVIAVVIAAIIVWSSCRGDREYELNRYRG